MWITTWNLNKVRLLHLSKLVNSLLSFITRLGKILCKLFACWKSSSFFAIYMFMFYGTVVTNVIQTFIIHSLPLISSFFPCVHVLELDI